MYLLNITSFTHLIMVIFLFCSQLNNVISFMKIKKKSTLCFYSKVKKLIHFDVIQQKRSYNTGSYKGRNNMRVSESIELEKEILHILLNKCNISSSKKTFLLMSISGGVDSMAMLHLLGRVKSQSLPLLNLSVINFNHKARIEADYEMELVRKQALLYDMTFHSRILNVNDRHEEPGFQEFARNWRIGESMKILNEVKSRNEYDDIAIATGHHMDDQIETILLKLLRGVHISNLYPMLPRSDCKLFIRPLLDITKDRLINYMNTEALEWSEDSSNSVRKYKRNKVRLDLIPLMESLSGGQGNLHKRLMSLAIQSKDLKNELNQASIQFLTDDTNVSRFNDETFVNCHEFIKLSTLVQSEVIFRLLDDVGVQSSNLDSDKITDLVNLATNNLPCGSKTKSLRISYEWIATKYSDNMLLFKRHLPISWKCMKLGNNSNHILVFPKDMFVSSTIEATCSSVEFSSYSEITKYLSNNISKQNKILLKDEKCTFTLRNLPQSAIILISHATDGDIFYPFIDSNVRLVEFFRNIKLSSSQRERVPVIKVIEVDENFKDITWNQENIINALESIWKIPNKVAAIPPLVAHEYNNHEKNSITLTIKTILGNIAKT